MQRLSVYLLLTLFVGGLAARAAADGFVVVAHAEVEGSTISRETLRAIYLKKVLRWSDQTSIQPVDQSSHSPVRQAFSEEVLGQSLGELQMFWRNRLTVDRVLPPQIQATDAEVLEFVASHRGAIGYVSAEASLPPDVKAVRIKD